MWFWGVSALHLFFVVGWVCFSFLFVTACLGSFLFLLLLLSLVVVVVFSVLQTQRDVRYER